MRALCAGKDHFRFAWRNDGRRRQAHLDVLVTQELHTGTSMHSPAPVSPEKWRIPDGQGMQQDADLARFLGGAALPLTLRP
jgi:hypothetical protein